LSLSFSLFLLSDALADKAGRQVRACACVNDVGETQMGGYCPYSAGSNVNVDGRDYVDYIWPELDRPVSFRFVSFSPI
jgi:hypothetical protein